MKRNFVNLVLSLFAVVFGVNSTAHGQQQQQAVDPMSCSILLLPTSTSGTYNAFFGLPQSGYTTFAHVGIFTDTARTELGFTDMSDVSGLVSTTNPLHPSNTNGALIQYSTGGLISGTLDASSGSGIADITFSGYYTTHGFAWGTNGSGDLTMLRADGTSMATHMFDLYEYAMSVECSVSPPTNYPVAAIWEAIGSCVAVVAGVTNTYACIKDALSASNGGYTNCRANFGLASGAYCPTRLDACFQCVSEKFNEDNVNCAITAGTNGPDGDYGDCITSAQLEYCE